MPWKFSGSAFLAELFFVLGAFAVLLGGLSGNLTLGASLGFALFIASHAFLKRSDNERKA
jgi:hypothetical protein